ncbi:prolyl oligopeptidase family serine peptidase [bacterium]|nr:prolyl oligopeptidase family serine peptidase [bacterium]
MILDFKNVLISLAFLIIMVITISSYAFYISVCPRRFVSSINPANFGLKCEEINFRTRDGLILKGWFIPKEGKKTTIIVCHGYPFDKGNILPSSLFLRREYNLFLFDFRAMGESEGRYTTAGYHEKKDLLAAIDYLKSRGIERIGALGFSLGGAVIIMAHSPDIKAIVSDSSYATLDLMIHSLFRHYHFLRYPFVFTAKLLSRLVLKFNTSSVSPVDTIKEVETPILLIHGEGDSQIPVKNAYLLHGAAPKSKLWIVPGADHGEAQVLATIEYEKRVLEFFKKNLS